MIHPGTVLNANTPPTHPNKTMSDSPTKPSSRRRRRPRSNSGGQPHVSTPRGGQVKQTGFQKFLSVITFGLLGKPEALPKVHVRSSAPTPQGAKTGSPRPPREPRQRREPSAPNPADLTPERLYVGNLSYDATESDRFELFNGVGSVRNAEVVVNSRTQRSKGFAFVTMASMDEARRAVAELHGKEFMGRPLQLSGAKPIGHGPDVSEEEEKVAA